ncbi:hypothetical protein D3C80_1866860 [compost metagenome]
MLNRLRGLIRPGSQLFGRGGYIVRHLLHTDNHPAQTGNHCPEIIGKHADLIPAERSDILG